VAVVSQQLVPHAGGSGRVLAYEILIKNHAVASHIRECKTHQTRTVIEGARNEGMITMDWRLKELFDAGAITWEEVVRRVSSPSFLEQIAMRAAPRRGTPG
jgi:twitching motility protein PilT